MDLATPISVLRCLPPSFFRQPFSLLDSTKEKNVRVAFQGETGAFSEEAVRAFFGDVEAVPCAAFEDVFAALEKGEVNRAAVPIENSLHGSVHANYDLLRTHETIRIVSEKWVRIRHFLMARPGASLDTLRSVRSHPQALGQCRAYLREKLPQAEAAPAYDTAGAAREIAASTDDTVAAIASRRAADEYGLHVLAEHIESNTENYTRFLALAPAADAPKAAPDTPCKTSLTFAFQENAPGSLFKSLAVFALRDLDLFKIESRPLVGEPGQYVFYLDVEGAADTEPVRLALYHLRELTRFVRVLGSYPRDE